MDREKLGLASEERRNFLRLAGTGSFTAAVVAGAGGLLWSSEAVAQTAREEKVREGAADHVMTLATAYVLGASRSYPIMQLDLKENIQNATNGKVYVKLAPGGQLGAGGALAQLGNLGTAGGPALYAVVLAMGGLGGIAMLTAALCLAGIVALALVFGRIVSIAPSGD